MMVCQVTVKTSIYPQNSIQLEMISCFTALDAPQSEQPNWRIKEILLEMQIRTLLLQTFLYPILPKQKDK